MALLWDVVKSDVRNTLKSVCYKALFDHSVSETTRTARAEALLSLGNIYCSKVVVNEQKSLEDLLTKLGRQSGLFDADDLHEKARRGHADGEDGDEASDANEHWKEMRQRFENAANGSQPSIPIKELKASIIELGGDPNQCIERADLEQKFKELIDKKLASI